MLIDGNDGNSEHPESQIIGTDLSPIQPGWYVRILMLYLIIPMPNHSACRVPPNLRFEIDDVESDWAYQSNFDFIHLRILGGSLKDVPKVIRQAFQRLNPGGWLE